MGFLPQLGKYGSTMPTPRPHSLMCILGCLDMHGVHAAKNVANLRIDSRNFGIDVMKSSEDLFNLGSPPSQNKKLRAST